MSSIGSEKERWITTKAKLAEDKISLLGDCILSAAFITYLGPFEGTYRMKIMRETWQPLISAYQIKQTTNFSLKEILGEVNQLAEWGINGLPNENVSYENMIIIEESKRKMYPVLIDPQGQALKYFRDYLGRKHKDLISTKITQPNAIGQIEKAI